MVTSRQSEATGTKLGRKSSASSRLAGQAEQARDRLGTLAGGGDPPVIAHVEFGPVGETERPAVAGFVAAAIGEFDTGRGAQRYGSVDVHDHHLMNDVLP